MDMRSRFQCSPNPAAHLSARIQPRPWSEPEAERSPAIEQPQGAIADFSHVDLFSHAPVRGPIQTKLTVGEPNDPYEQEADRVAEQMMSMTPPAAPNLQRQPEADALEAQEPSTQRQEEPVEELQTKTEITALQRQAVADELQARFIQRQGDEIASGDTSPDLEAAINSARGSGGPLEAGLQRSMGQAMGADFSGVRVHTNAQADQLNQSIQAKAFTTGQDVFFRQGSYEPGSRGGQELIAHELTHVAQQSGREVRRTPIESLIQAAPGRIHSSSLAPYLYDPDKNESFDLGEGQMIPPVGTFVEYELKGTEAFITKVHTIATTAQIITDVAKSMGIKDPTLLSLLLDFDADQIKSSASIRGQLAKYLKDWKSFTACYSTADSLFKLLMIGPPLDRPPATISETLKSLLSTMKAFASDGGIFKIRCGIHGFVIMIRGGKAELLQSFAGPSGEMLASSITANKTFSYPDIEKWLTQMVSDDPEERASSQTILFGGTVTDDWPPSEFNWSSAPLKQPEDIADAVANRIEENLKASGGILKRQ
jgi:hypothetical protein